MSWSSEAAAAERKALLAPSSYGSNTSSCYGKR